METNGRIEDNKVIDTCNFLNLWKCDMPCLDEGWNFKFLHYLHLGLWMYEFEQMVDAFIKQERTKEVTVGNAVIMLLLYACGVFYKHFRRWTKGYLHVGKFCMNIHYQCIQDKGYAN